MKKPVGFELLKLGNEYEFIVKNKPNSSKGIVIDISEDTITYEYKTRAIFPKNGIDTFVEGKNKRTLNIKDIQEIKEI